MNNNNQQQQPANRENITNAQFTTLLSTVNVVLNGLREVQTEENGVPRTDRLAGEAQIALTTTLIKTLDRIDSLMDDKTRWTLDRVLDIEHRLNETLENQNAFFRSQRETADEQRRPYFILRPELKKTSQGWIAFHGNPAEADSLIVGAGDSPAEAMDNFDRAYYRRMTPEEKSVLETQVIPDNLNEQ